MALADYGELAPARPYSLFVPEVPRPKLTLEQLWERYPRQNVALVTWGTTDIQADSAARQGAVWAEDYRYKIRHRITTIGGPMSRCRLFAVAGSQYSYRGVDYFSAWWLVPVRVIPEDLLAAALAVVPDTPEDDSEG